MTRTRLLALAEQKARHESGDARVDMNDGSAGKVEDLEHAEVALASTLAALMKPSGPQTQWATGA